MAEEVSGPPAPITPYTACFCEENVYLLAEALKRLLPSSAKIFPVVISNPTKTVAIWQQLASTYSAFEDFLVVWDYHVILCMKVSDEEGLWVYDVDTRLGSPCKWDRYIRETFKSDLITNLSESEHVPIAEPFRCMFRVVPAEDFLANFSSDRSHMLRISPESGNEEYISPPPDYPPIIGSRAADLGKVNTLMAEWVDMTVEYEGHGIVLSDHEFLKDTSWTERF